MQDTDKLGCIWYPLGPRHTAGTGVRDRKHTDEDEEMWGWGLWGLHT